MKLSIAGWLVFATGAAVAAGEFVMAMIVSGTTIAEGSIFDNGKPSAEIVADVRPEHFPLRVILNVEGVRRGFTQSERENAIAVTLDFGNAGVPRNEISLVRVRNQSAKPNYFNIYHPVNLEEIPAGEWRLSADVNPGENIELETAHLELKAGVRSPNIMLIIIAGLVAMLGMATGLIGRR